MIMTRFVQERLQHMPQTADIMGKSRDDASMGQIASTELCGVLVTVNTHLVGASRYLQRNAKHKLSILSPMQETTGTEQRADMLALRCWGTFRRASSLALASRRLMIRRYCFAFTYVGGSSVTCCSVSHGRIYDQDIRKARKNVTLTNETNDLRQL